MERSFRYPLDTVARNIEKRVLEHFRIGSPRRPHSLRDLQTVNIVPELFYCSIIQAIRRFIAPLSIATSCILLPT